MVDAGEVKGKITLDVSGLKKGADEAERAMSDMASSVETSGKKASESVDKVGTTSETSSAKVKKSSEGSGKAFLGAAQSATTLAMSAYVLYDSYDGVQSAQTASERANLKLSKANEAVEKAQDALNKAVAKYGQDSPEAIQASLDLAQAQDMSTIASQNAEMAAGNLDDAWVQFSLGGITSVLGIISGAGGMIETIKSLSGMHMPNFGKAINSVGSILKTAGGSLLTNPIFLIATAIALVAILIITNWDAVKPFFEGLWNALKGIFEAAWGVIDAVVIKPLMAAWGLISQAAGIMRDVLIGIWNAIVGALTVAWNLINQYIIQPILTAWNWIQQGAEIMRGILIGIWNAIVGALTVAWNLINQYVIQPLLAGWNLLQTATEIMKGILVGIWNALYDAILGVWNWIDQNIVTPIKAAWDAITNAAGIMKQGLETIWNGIKSVIDTVVGGIMSIIQPLIDAMNTVFGLAGDIGDAVGAVIPDGDLIPGFHLFAEGGMVTRPTLAMIGEGGEPEYVVPQSKVAQFMNFMAGSGAATPIPNLGGAALSTISTSSSSVRSIGQVVNNWNIRTDDPKAVMKEIYKNSKSLFGVGT
jgi:phage-related protein